MPAALFHSYTCFVSNTPPPPPPPPPPTLASGVQFGIHRHGIRMMIYNRYAIKIDPLLTEIVSTKCPVNYR